MTTRCAAMAAALLLAAIAPAVAQDNCKLTPIASMPLTLENNQPSVPVAIGDKPFHFLVDTGGFHSEVTDRVAKSLGTELKPVLSGEIGGLGGERLTHYVDAPNVALGRLVTPSYQLLVMPASDPFPLDGILAPDILLAFDIDFDFGKGRLNLISPDHCIGRVTYWTDGDVARLPFVMDRTGHIKVTLQVDGQDFPALLDTGATESFISLEKAERQLGVDAKSPDLHPGGLVNGRVPSFFYRFKTLSLGGLTVQNPTIMLLPQDKAQMGATVAGWETPTALLGMDVLSKLHVYIAYKERMLYVTPAEAH